MNADSIHCPWCSAPLRVKDHALVGSVIACPDCGAQIRIVDGGSLGLSMEKVSAAETVRSAAPRSPAALPEIRRASKRAPVESGDLLNPWRERAKRFVGIASRGVALIGRLKDPLVLCWTVAIGFTIVMLFVIKPWSGGAQHPPIEEIALRDTPSETGSPPAVPKLLPPQMDESPQDLGEGIQTNTLSASERSSPDTQPAPRFAVVAQRPPRAVVAARPVSVASAPVVAMAPTPQPEPAPRLNVPAALEQRIEAFELTSAVPLEKLLPEIEEMAGVPIHAEPSQIRDLAAMLAKPVKTQLKQTTVGAILRELLQQAGLDYETRPDGIHLREKS